MPVSKELAGASTTPLVLAILRRGPSYGYAIVKQVRELSSGALEWTEGMLYPVLHRLEKAGLVSSHEEKAATGRARRYYALTRSGRKQLEAEKREWLAMHAVLSAAWEGWR